jgi:hypothetical protein
MGDPNHGDPPDGRGMAREAAPNWPASPAPCRGSKVTPVSPSGAALRVDCSTD